MALHQGKQLGKQCVPHRAGIAYFISGFVFQGVLSSSSCRVKTISLLRKGPKDKFNFFCLSSLRDMKANFSLQWTWIIQNMGV